MPDDIKEEIAEQEADEKEAEEAFREDESGEGKKKSDDKDDDAGDSSDGDSGDEDDKGDGGGDDEGEEPTPKQIAEKRAGIEPEDDKGDGKDNKEESNNPYLSFLSEEGGDVEAEEADDKDEKDDKDDKKGDDGDQGDKDDKSLAKIKAFTKILSDFKLDGDFKPEEYVENYPDDAQFMLYALRALVGENIAPRPPAEGNYVTREELAEIQFKMEVVDRHPDASEITAMNKSTGELLNPEFAEWSKNQPVAIRRLFVAGKKTVADAAEDFIAGLDYYKFSMKDKKAKDFDDNARKTKKEKDDLHSHTMRSKKAGRKSKKTFEDQEAEAEAAFEKE